MNYNYLVSIIVPAYNAEQYLNRCIDSLVQQSYDKLEIIIVNDGSNDDTSLIAENWSKQDKRIKLINKQNDGLSNARNSGIEIASGDYVMFVDADDSVEPDMVAFLLELSTKYDAEVSRCGFYFHYENGECKSADENYDIQLLSCEERIIDLMIGGHVSGVAWNKLYKKDVIKTHFYNKADGCSEDIMHNYRVYKDIQNSVFCNRPKYHYYINKGSITNSQFGYGAFDIIRAKKIILDESIGNPVFEDYAIESYVKSAYIVLSGCIKHNACMDRYDELRNSILKYKTKIFRGKRYSINHKIRTVLLWLCPSLYDFLVRMKG